VDCTQILPEFECQCQRSKVKVTTDKKRKTAESSPLTMHSKACAVGGTQQAATDDTVAWPPGGDRLCQWENQHMLSSVLFSPLTLMAGWQEGHAAHKKPIPLVCRGSVVELVEEEDPSSLTSSSSSSFTTTTTSTSFSLSLRSLRSVL